MGKTSQSLLHREFQVSLGVQKTLSQTNKEGEKSRTCCRAEVHRREKSPEQPWVGWDTSLPVKSTSLDTSPLSPLSPFCPGGPSFPGRPSSPASPFSPFSPGFPVAPGNPARKQCHINSCAQFCFTLCKDCTFAERFCKPTTKPLTTLPQMLLYTHYGMELPSGWGDVITKWLLLRNLAESLS